MNKALITTSALALVFMLASANPALAEDGQVQVEASAETEVRTEPVKRPAFLNFPFKLGSTTSRVDKDRREAWKASMTEDREDKVPMQRASTTEKRIEKGIEKAGDAIDRRIKSLQELIARLGKIKLLTPDQLASLTATLNAEIQSLTELKAKVATDTATTTLKADIKSITQDHRVFGLIEPQARIAAAASRINAVVTQLTQLADKLQERITAAQSAGVNVSVAVSAMTDLKTKLASAKTNADAAVSLTANLKPDGGDKTVMEANKAALTEARKKLAAAHQDLAAARHSVARIYSVVKGKGEVKASTTPTTP